MIQILRDAAKLLLCGVLWCLLPSCINEDLTNCGYDYMINYNVSLQTNLSVRLTEELDKIEQQPIAAVLENELSAVFSDIAKDIDLSFYHQHALSHNEKHEIDASSASFTIYLPVNDYQHLALANVEACPIVSSSNVTVDSLYKISNNVWADTIDPHPVGLFSARMPMAVEDKDTTFNVLLTMCNSAVAVVINTNGYQPKSVFGFAKGFATGFMPNDSVFMFERTQAVRAKLVSDGGQYMSLYTVNFPSRDFLPAGIASCEDAKTLSNATEQSVNHEIKKSANATGLWQFYVYVQMEDKWTENILSISDPLKAGMLKIITLNLLSDGTVVSDLPEVGVSVTLDWNSAGDYEIPI